VTVVLSLSCVVNAASLVTDATFAISTVNVPA